MLTKLLIFFLQSTDYVMVNNKNIFQNMLSIKLFILLIFNKKSSNDLWNDLLFDILRKSDKGLEQKWIRYFMSA